MKTATSSLNPFAESYVPLSLRQTSSYDPESGSSTSLGANKVLPATDDSKPKTQDIPNHSLGAPAQITDQSMITDVKLGDEDIEMDLAYLQMSFPGMSDQSVMDVYAVNGRDLEASMDMLSQLESVESSNTLPDALDIGDVPEIVSSAERSSAKSKSAVAKESTNSHGNPKLGIAS